uniref:RanBP2-type domain-containing protein n=2 Tax=Triticinae TaxID=1648030 RepID=A0A453EVP8_AEGTS
MIRWVFFYMVTINAKGLHFYLNHYIWLLRLLDCTVQNYANRTKCFRCNAPKSYYG